MIEVKASLNKFEYKTACDAHVMANEISIIGELQRKGSTWEVVNISSVEAS
jgi:hypothetical protein